MGESDPCDKILVRGSWVINKPALPFGNTQFRMSSLNQQISVFVEQSITSGNRPVSIAGDCCTSIGVMAGMQRVGGHPVLIWFDAHGDFNTWETTPSGFLGGMPLAMLVGRGEQTLLNAVGLHPILETEIILSDGRDLDSKERQALAGSGVHHLKDIHALLDHPLITQPLYVHFDTDIINPQDAPAMSYLAQGGPSAAELQVLFRTLAQTGQVKAVSMSTWNPRLDRDGQNQAISMALLHALIDP